MTKRQHASVLLTTGKRGPWQFPAMDIGDKIRAKRREAGLTQRDLAKLVGVSPGAVGQWEGGGGGKGISTANLMKLTAALGMDIDDVLSQATLDAPLTVVDPEEKAAIHAMRLLDSRLRSAHVRLLFAQIATSRAADEKSDPTAPVRAVG